MLSSKRFTRPTPSPRKRDFLRLVEELEPRLPPAGFNPLPSTPDGAPLSLRDAILQADGNGDAANTIRLGPGTYTLTDALDGNLLIQNTAVGVPGKTLTVVGQGAG